MGLRTFYDPFAGQAPQIDKRIGDAYPVVEAVAHKLNEIAYVVSNMEAVVQVAQNLEAEISLLVLGTMGPLNAATVVNLPAEVSLTKLRSSTVMLVTSTSEVYTEGSDVFTCKIISGQLRIDPKSGAPTSLLGSQIRWRLTFAP